MRDPFLGRKFALSLGLILVSIVYALSQRFSSAASTLATSTVTIEPPSIKIETAPAVPPVASSPSAPPPSSMPMQPMMSSGVYKDGTYTGNPADAYYGIIQVAAIVKNGRLADVQFLQYPNDRDTSLQVNGMAMPLLTREAIQAQSAQVDGVSGATETSAAFVDSLSSALALAKK